MATYLHKIVERGLGAYTPWPATPEEANWYEYLRHAHCHKCPFRIDCDVEDFLSCEVPIGLASSDPRFSRNIPEDKKFHVCSCFQCIDDKKLKQIIQAYYGRAEKLYKTKERKKEKVEVKKKGPAEAPFKKKPAKAAPKRGPIQQSLFGIRKKAS